MKEFIKMLKEEGFKKQWGNPRKLATIYECCDSLGMEPFDLFGTDTETEILKAVYQALDPVKIEKKTIRSDVSRIDSDDTIIITSAQNNSSVHTDAWEGLQELAHSLGARLFVMPVKYNKHAFSQAVEDESENWSPEVQPYMLEKDVISDDFAAYTTSHILPTAKYPMNAGADLNDGERYTIVASPKCQQKELPRTVGQSERTVLTTGSITLPNYLNSRAGSVAETEHVIGCILIKDGKAEFLEFSEEYGWSYEFSTLVVGDVHTENLDDTAFQKTIDFIEANNINTVVLHDLLDFRNRNGHNRNDARHLFVEQDRSVQDDLNEVISVLYGLSDIDCVKNIIIVRSNHDDMLDRWLTDTSYRPHLDPKNAKLFHELSFYMYGFLEDTSEMPNMLKLAISDRVSDKVRFLELDSSYQAHGVELSQHGHKGTNGARTGLQKTGYSMVTGHSHTGGRFGKHVVVGTIAKLQQGYNAGGGTTWTQHNAAICKSGRVKLIEL